MDRFLEVSFSRRLKTPEGIARRVPGVWVLSLPTYFNCCPFFLKTPNCRSPSGYQLIFISKKGNSSSVMIWTGSSFLGVGGFASSVHISAVNFRCWFPAAKFTVCWNFSSQSFISLFFLSLEKPQGLHIDRCRGILLVEKLGWLFRKGKRRLGLPGMHIRIRQSLILVLLSLPRDIRSITCRSRWGSNSYQIGWDPNKGWLFSWFHWWVYSQKYHCLF